MKKVLILGANGQIAKIVSHDLLSEDIDQRLFLRRSSRLTTKNPKKQEIIEGDALNQADLEVAMKDVDIVYANLAGEIIEEAKLVVSAMKKTGVKRLIWISTLGIYDEVPGNYGKWNHQQLDGGYLETYAEAAKIIEASELDYTIIRPAWLDNKDEIDYELTQRNETFKGTEVSRKSIAHLVSQIILNPDQHIGESLGVNKPNTDGDKPAWIK
ncbi:SDR family oxidoreductase [Vagococcus carniphilus]|uniref:SDR family oxidoreductase n=1 Tax=Vagococcus carniphilus TaxID=218144 RepID=A0AAW8U7Q4_9ENTE|nr:SDR family oxidoreductase [Vagococcus carniphilus]MDT2830717.1 SDR family oxidoreductase [Vagococcus carniphilus]MDT2833020.1 SDR family oxidoreductase [Vagococcus carniphilus]MDT2839511.1 SDR family oxidoreductase [Vagococcus carniphilus]MDT2849591.1 SDR family oxidoreductase [Vagococcus carniphilus]MDT2853880.1 SDR family oxidoreductase [Vagococcus carniphilus]